MPIRSSSDGNPIKVPADAIKDIKVQETIKAGTTIYPAK
jgi:predicted amidohydrolase YtcJ